MDADEGLVDESLSKLGAHTRKRNRNAILAFLSWTKNHGDFANLEEIIKFQEKATGRDSYRLGDLIETSDRELGGSTNTMRWRNAILRGFFERLHVEMPKQRFNFVPTKDTLQSLLSEEVVRTLLNECDLEDRAVYICLYQSMMDQHRFFSVVVPTQKRLAALLFPYPIVRYLINKLGLFVERSRYLSKSPRPKLAINYLAAGYK